MSQLHVRDSSNGAKIRVRVTPKAKKSMLRGVREGALLVSVVAPPIDGKANQAVCELLAQLLGVSKSRVRIVSGESARDKWVEVRDATAGELVSKLCPE